MREIVRLTPADARRVPWKNGLGVTEELAIWPPGALFEEGGFDWRISKAAVVESGPFSSFPGFDRILVVISGDGLVLEHGGRAPRAEVAPLAPYGFAGDWPTTAELVGGPVHDFNVIVRRGHLQGDVSPLVLDGHARRTELRAGHAFLHLLVGEAEVQDRRLGAGDSLWVRDAQEGDQLDLAGAGVALLARVG